MPLKYKFLILFSTVSFWSFAQEVNLKSLLQNAENKLSINFNYREKDVANTFLSPCSYVDFKTLKSCIESQTSLELRRINDKTVAVALKNYLYDENDDSLYRHPILLDEVLVNYQALGVNKLSDGDFIIKSSEVKMVSGAVNADVFTLLEQFPGVLNLNESIGDLYVHGGTPDQNLVQWNGIRLYQNSHVFGGISSINPTAIDEIVFYKSGVPANWGDHTGGFIQMNSKSNSSPSNYQLGISLLDSYFGAHFKLGEHLKFNLSARSSLPNSFGISSSDAFVKQLIQNSTLASLSNPIKNSNYRDFTWKTHYSISENQALELSAFRVQDDFNYNLIESSVQYTEALQSYNHGFGLLWYVNNGAFRSKLSVSNSIYHLGFSRSILEEEIDSDEDEIELRSIEQLSRTNNLNDLSLKWEGHRIVNATSFVDFGYEFNKKQILFKRKTESDALSENKSFNSNHLNFHSLYSNLKYTSPNGFLFNSGLRFNYYNVFHAFLVEPRINISKAFGNHFNGYMTYEKKSQNAIQSQESVSSTIAQRNPMWIGAEKGVVPLLKTNQQTIGFTYYDKGFVVDIEGFQKHWNDITTLNYGYIDPHDRDYHLGESKAYGFNLFLKNRGEHLSTWATYGFMDLKNRFSDINNEQWYVGNFNLKHSLKFGIDLQLNRFQMGATYSYHTGLPFSEPIGTFINETDGHLGFEYNTINGQLLPSYNRLDASLLYDFKFKSLKNSSLRMSLLNITNEKNILNKTFVYSSSTEKILSVSTYSIEPVFNVGLFFSL